MEWISVKEKLPDKNGNYLCYIKSFYGNIMSIYSFALNLKKVDEYDFYGKKRCGWYNYDSEYGYYEVGDVAYWMPLPEAPSDN